MQAEGRCHNVTSPREDAQDHDIFISLSGTLYVIVNCRKDKDKALKEHILKDIVPGGFDARIEEIQEKPRKAIEEKNAPIALLMMIYRPSNMKTLAFWLSYRKKISR